MKVEPEGSPYRTCSVPGCGRRHNSQGFCSAHEYRHRNGLPLNEPLREHRPAGATFDRDEAGRKQCSKCGVWKSETSFGRHLKQPDGLRVRCRKCSTLRGCDKGRPSRGDKDLAVVNGVSDRTLRKYSKTREWFELELTRIGGRCPGCRVVRIEGVPWHIDHDHDCCPGGRSCGACVRGVLCPPCNMALGFLRDSRETLVNLERYLYEYETRTE